ncbi:glycine zipper family protein [Helicobacter hepaticus]|jgi:hypothetical protein|uniref:Uncharacterized protein n=1 Tax=Helicobacter hepaticus (strain ATCC 51449 / 3B1) TaxID=235279 RepID=Q7VJK8_HELHP|nr:glycine zipper family protein [Helicobacter hepaticus]AAP76832.1 hypothetical protein HH_0235 [Helicobacter hepaticus ATCC 51449]
MKTIYESDEIVVTQQDNLTYYMQINNQDKVSNDSSALTSAISAIRNAVWALDVYSNTKVQLIVVVLGSTPNALIMQNNPNNSQLKNFIVLNLDVIVGFSATKIAPKILNKALIGAGIGTLAGSIIPGLGNAAGATSGFIAGAGRVLFLAGVGYFSTAILSNIYDALEIDELYDYLKKNIFSSQNKYEQETLRNPTEQELKIVLSNIDSNSTSNDIDKLLHSFPNYLKQDSQQESHIPQLYLLSPLLFSSDTINSHRVGEIHFQIQALDEYTRIPIENAKLQLQNVNLGQESITNTQGLATFMIKESEYLKPFMAKLIHNNYQECPIFDRSIIPNAYRSAKKPLELRFLGKIHCYFNGKELYINNGNKAIDYFNAYSGNALSLGEKEELIKQYGYESFVSYKDNQNKISYFCLDKEWQKQKDKGAIPDGIYYIDINKSKNDKSSGIRMVSKRDRQIQWGKYNIPIYTNKECTNTIESTTQRNNFYIHGGESYGDNGGIDETL